MSSIKLPQKGLDCRLKIDAQHELNQASRLAFIINYAKTVETHLNSKL